MNRTYHIRITEGYDRGTDVIRQATRASENILHLVYEYSLEFDQIGYAHVEYTPRVRAKLSGHIKGQPTDCTIEAHY